MPNPDAWAAALVEAHAGPVDALPDRHRLVDYAESSRAGGWSLRSALVRFAQPQPTRAGAVLELVRRTDGALKPHRRLLESLSVPTHPDLGPQVLDEAVGSPAIRADTRRVLDAPATDLARAALRLTDGDDVVTAYAAAVGDHPTFAAVPLLVVAIELDAIAEVLVAWAEAHDGPPPVAQIDQHAVAAFARLEALDVPRETAERPPGRSRG